MKLTWHSNVPWNGSGYGTQTAQVVRRLVADGHDVAIAANFGTYGATIPWIDPISEAVVPVYPCGIDRYSQDVLAGHHKRHLAGQPGWLITLFDTWVLDAPSLAPYNVASWAPIDHMPVPPKVAEWCAAHTTIAMSRFGEKMLERVGIKSTYIPHALEPSIWKPTPSDARQRLNIPDDAFLVMIAAANQGNFPVRKAWNEMFAGLALFLQDHPDTYIYCHTDALNTSGIDLVFLAAAFGLPTSRIRWADTYSYRTGLYQSSDLAQLYTAADVLLATSMGEGFGIPVIEAQACGTPVIVTDFSAQPELVGAGWKVGWQPAWDPAQASWFATPLVPEINQALGAAFAAKGSEKVRADALAKAAEYDADKVYAENWRPFLAQLAPTRQQRRAAARKKAA